MYSIGSTRTRLLKAAFGRLLFLFVSFCFQPGIASNSTTGNQCLREIPIECQRRLCFTFLKEEPFVLTTRKLEAEGTPMPFVCTRRHEKYPGLDGFFFNLLDRLSTADEEIREALCIFGGSGCTFNAEVRAVADVSIRNPEYRIIAGGYMLFLEDRFIQGVIPSAHVFVETMSLMYLPGRYAGGFREAFDNILGPFEWSGWCVVVLYALLVLFCFAMFVLRYRPNNNPRDVMNWLVNPQEFGGFTERLAWLMLPVGVAVFATVLVLLYEIAVAAFIFEGRPPLVTSLEQLASLGLGNFALVGGGASENVFRAIVDPQGRYGANPPWTGVKDLETMIKLLLSGKKDFLVSWRTNFEYWLHRLNLCDRVVTISLPKMEVGGWYFGIGVPEETRLRINKALMAIWQKKETEVLLYNYGRSPLSCGVENRQVDHRVVLILLSITVLPFLLAFCTIMCVPWVRRMILRFIPMQRKNQLPVVDDVDEANGNR